MRHKFSTLLLFLSSDGTSSCSRNKTLLLVCSTGIPSNLSNPSNPSDPSDSFECRLCVNKQGVSRPSGNGAAMTMMTTTGGFEIPPNFVPPPPPREVGKCPVPPPFPLVPRHCISTRRPRPAPSHGPPSIFSLFLYLSLREEHPSSDRCHRRCQIPPNFVPLLMLTH